jgi:hypothetical protein
MATRSGASYNNMSDGSITSERGVATTILITYAIGTTQHYPILLEDVYNMDTGKLVDDVMSVVIEPIDVLQADMVEGWTDGKVEALGEALSRGDMRVVLRRKDGIEINLGHSQEQMERTKKQYKIAAMTQSEIQMVISVKGFDTTAPIGGPDIKPDVDTYPARMFPSKYNMSQFVTSRHVVPKSAIVKQTVKTESQEEDARKEIGEAYSMEERMNPKEFQRTSSVKLTSRGDTLEWYDIMVAHGEMNGMFIPPSFSITPELIMGNLWTKRLIGETIHARRKTMSNHLHKILMTEDMFSKDCQDEYREIVRAARGDGYAALHNIMRLHHPRLTERRVETKYPSQYVTACFTQHAKDVQVYIDREAIRGRLYSWYDSLQLVLDKLHPSYHMKLKQQCEREL